MGPLGEGMGQALRRLCVAGAGAAAWFASTAAVAGPYVSVDSFAAPINATMMAYSSWADVLMLKNTASAVAAVKVSTRQSTIRLANVQFTDLALSPGGRFAFVADYGGENIGYGTPFGTHYVHRLNLANLTWELRTAFIAGRIQAVSDSQVILQSLDQWVTFTNNAWGSGASLETLNSPGYWTTPGYYAWAYSGDIAYDWRTGRLLHGNSGLSSQEILTYRLVNNEFVTQESSGIYGSAQGYGGTVVLANDGSRFYYGSLQVDPLDVTHNFRAFPEWIYAASADIALGNGKYYDAHTGALLGSLPFNTTVYAMAPSGNDFWAYDPATTTVHRFSMLPAPAEYGDLEFTAITPCRIYDTRPSQGGGGTWMAGSTNMVSVGPNASYAFQGGSASDCGMLAGMATGRIAAVMAAVSTANQAGAGFLALFPAGGVNPYPTSITQGYRANLVQTSFVVMPTDGAGSAKVSGFTTAQANVIIDIVGYFAKPKALALDCYASAPVSLPVAAGAEAQPAGAACSAGYAYVDTACQADSTLVSLFAIDGACGYRNHDSVARNVSAISTCCRAPGR